MKVLFVSSGNSSDGISPVVFNQGEALKKEGIELEYFTVRGKGLKGYIKGIKDLADYPALSSFDVIHAHYSLSAILAGLALLLSNGRNKRKVVASLMGSDVHSSFLHRVIIRFFHRRIWQRTIVKSREMYDVMGLSSAEVIPNGVDIELFRPGSRQEARKSIGISNEAAIIIFVSDPLRPEKNFKLAEKAVEKLYGDTSNLLVVNNMPVNMIPLYMNAADLLLLTSLWEGSVNVVKEAMACDSPIVATAVGDVMWVLGNTPGTFLTDGSVENTAEMINEALDFSAFNKSTGGRERILTLGLDSRSISKRLINIYLNITENN
ncbi:MAG: glycosyltransferase [Bacteroidia bacterium]|nr:MAG: glycosyltransferase [Bacteroidia bacterium]